jgi:hypothetical protein
LEQKTALGRVNLCREILSVVGVSLDENFQYPQEILDASLRTFWFGGGRDCLCTEDGLDRAALVVPDPATQITSGSKKKKPLSFDMIQAEMQIPNMEYGLNFGLRSAILDSTDRKNKCT